MITIAANSCRGKYKPYFLIFTCYFLIFLHYEKNIKRHIINLG